jgi:hypothetical protein
MPITKEFTVLVEDGPGTLGKVFRALAECGVNSRTSGLPDRRQERNSIHRRQSGERQDGPGQ